MTRFLSRWIVRLERFTDKAWYLPFLGFLAGLDMFVWVIPTDGLLVSAAMLRPKRWIAAFLWFTTGSSLGALIGAALIKFYGDPVLHFFAGDALNSEGWARAAQFIHDYGPWAIGISALGPLPMQPPILIASAAGMSLTSLFVSMWIGRAIKYAFFAWIATHAPGLLKRIWPVRTEVAEIQEAEKAERQIP